jgi:hypothetical protein
MRMNFGQQIEIQDLGNHNVGTVVSLSVLLAGDVNVIPDPKRKHLYEIVSISTSYYVYVSPSSGIIFLVATWKNSVRYPNWKLWSFGHVVKRVKSVSRLAAQTTRSYWPV